MKVFGNYFAFRNPGKFLSLPPQSLKLKECFGQSLELSVQKTLRPKVFLQWRPSGLVVGRGAVEIFLKFAYGNFAFLGDKDQSDMAKMSKGRYASSSLDE